MAAGDRQSVEQEMDEVRARLADTIDQLVYRSNPKTIASRQVAEIKGYFVAPDGTPRPDNIVKVVGGVVGAVVVLAVIRRLVR